MVAATGKAYLSGDERYDALTNGSQSLRLLDRPPEIWSNIGKLVIDEAAVEIHAGIVGARNVGQWSRISEQNNRRIITGIELKVAGKAQGVDQAIIERVKGPFNVAECAQIGRRCQGVDAGGSGEADVAI
ncbi:hypothetical protein DOTSEDRAFT_27816 [Dothistroma septosporum NZE10]|uniref:Uncharacterized protein n=1 Tax=Dothistroma septosporum (strain NZE10 / CBS 128990) TaxID=675120 RepID=N1PE57_DOTSN|nr:hypothetical protein DOTSEDRAFT_27816 [Dothistroma septosporum NZE10]